MILRNREELHLTHATYEVHYSKRIKKHNVYTLSLAITFLDEARPTLIVRYSTSLLHIRCTGISIDQSGQLGLDRLQ
jgi:hypothetical protein